MAVAPAVALLLALLGAAAAASDQQSRLLHQAPATCNNTMAGRWYITDDKGMVCPRDSLDYATGCCTAGELHSCESCSEEDKCCSQYERCVSCCLKPEHQPEQHIHSIHRGRNKPETGLWATPFEYCGAVCRTTARSTQHENAFILDRRHCFSKLGRPHVAVPPAPPLPAGITLVAGPGGQTCDAACAAKQMGCKEEHFASLNDCNSLRAKFMCEAGCGPAAADQKEFPGYVEGNAPKHQKPAFCSTLPPFPGQAGPAFNCTGSAGSVRRLCPCEPLPVVVQQAGLADAAGAGGGAAVGTDAVRAAMAAAQQQTAAAADDTLQQQPQAAAAGEQQAAAGQAAEQTQQQQPDPAQLGQQQVAGAATQQ